MSERENTMWKWEIKMRLRSQVSVILQFWFLREQKKRIYANRQTFAPTRFSWLRALLWHIRNLNMFYVFLKIPCNTDAKPNWMKMAKRYAKFWNSLLCFQCRFRCSHAHTFFLILFPFWDAILIWMLETNIESEHKFINHNILTTIM